MARTSEHHWRIGRTAVLAYAAALDGREWAGFRSLFGEEVAIDYASLSGTAGVLKADAWTERCRVLEGFDATLHRISNLTVEREREGLVVTSYVDAVHFASVEGVVLEGACCGAYTHVLRPGGSGGWLIAGCTLRVAGFPGGGRAAFDAAFDAARARYAQAQAPGR